MRNCRRSAGFTLVELLIAIVVSGLVFTVVASAFTISVHSNNDSNSRLLEANAANSFSSWFTQDVQSATRLNTALRSCPDGSGTLLISVERSDAEVDYVYLGSGETGRVIRRMCGGPQLTVATSVAQPKIACLPDASCVGATGARAELTLEGLPASVDATRRVQ